MEHPRKMDDLGGKPAIFGNIHILATHFFGVCLCCIRYFEHSCRTIMHISSIVCTFLQMLWVTGPGQSFGTQYCRQPRPASAAGRQEARPESCRTVEEKRLKALGPTFVLSNRIRTSHQVLKLWRTSCSKLEIGTTGISHQEIQLVMHWTQGAHHADLIQLWLDFRQANIC